MEFNYKNESEDNETGNGGYGGYISLAKGQTGVNFTTKKITDPKSPYKTEYLIECKRDPGDASEVDAVLGSNFQHMQNFKNTGEEIIWVKILSPY